MPRLSLLIPPLAAAAVLAGGAAIPAHAQGQPQPAAAPAGGWKIAPITPADGPAYCAAEARFQNGLALVVARTPRGEVNLAVGIPGAKLPGDARFPLQLSVDTGIRRTLDGVAAEPDLIVISTGQDAELYEALRKGNQLTVKGPEDDAVFQLKGTSKALAELKDCAAGLTARATAGNAPAASDRPLLPPPLQAVLSRAGLTEIQVLNLDKLPPAQRPADYAWRFDGVSGGVKEFQAPPDADLAKLSGTYLDALRERCPGPFTAEPGDPATVGLVTLRPATVTCTQDGRKVTVELLFYLTQSGIFTVFSHEAEDPAAALARRTRDNIAQVIRDLAQREAAAPKGG